MADDPKLILHVMKSLITKVVCLASSSESEQARRPGDLLTGSARYENHLAVGRGNHKTGVNVTS